MSAITTKHTPFQGQRLHYAVTLLLLSTLPACSLGPDFRRPDAPAIANLTTPEQAARIAAQQGQKLVQSKDVPGQWWELFHSKPLNQLLEQALKRNPTLKSAQAVLKAAQENRLAKAAELLPTLDATLTSKHQKVSGAQFGNPSFGGSIFTLYNASVNVSYSLDVFGSLQRELEGMDAQTEYQRFQLEGAFLALSGNIVTSVIQEAALRAQIQCTEEIISAHSEQLAIIEQQLTIGSVAQAAVLNQQALLQQARNSLPPLHKQLAVIRHQLSVLVGDIPGSTALIAEFRLEDLQLPAELPLSLPAKLVTQRPDIRAQEAVLHAASANIGEVATVMFPDFTLNANLSSVATTAGNLFMPGTAVWGVGGALTQPLFHAGQIGHLKRAAVAGYEQAQADYRSTVLKALQNVADTLSALEFDHSELQAQNAALATASAALELSRSQLRVGAASNLEVLNAERNYQQVRIGQLQAQAARFADSAALLQALGGGWWNRPDLSKAIAKESPSTQKLESVFEIPRFRKLK